MSIEQTYVERNPASARLYQRAGKVLPSGVTHDSRFVRPFPVYAERAAGARKWDADGHELIDYVMGHGALMLGHNYPSSEWYFDTYELVEKRPVERPPAAPDTRSWIRRQVDWLF